MSPRLAAAAMAFVGVLSTLAAGDAPRRSASVAALENRARSYSLRGEYLLALPALRTACAAREQVPTNRGAVGRCLELLAQVLIQVSEFDEADRVLKRLQGIAAPPVGDRLSASRTLVLIALLQRWQGAYPQSAATLERALRLRADVATESDDRVMTAVLAGDLRFLTGDVPQAHREYGRAAAIPHSTPREASDHLVALRRLSFTEHYLGNVARATELATRAAEDGQHVLAECHDERAALLNDTAAIALAQADYFTARLLFQRSLAHKTRCAHVNGADMVTPLLNLARVAVEMGDTEEAGRLYERAAQAWAARYSPTHQFVALALDGLAGVALNERRPEEARRRWARALEVRRQSLGDDHPDVAWTLVNLARTELTLGDVRAAAASLERSARIYQRAGAPDRADRHLELLAVQADVQLRMGNTAAARELRNQALGLTVRYFGDGHPLSAAAHTALGKAHAQAGDADLALASALTAERIGREHLRRAISYLPERQALMYAGARPEGLNLAVSLAVHAGPAQRRVLDDVIRSRAVVLDELVARGRVRESDPALEVLRNTLTTARRRLANLSLRSLRERVPTPQAVMAEARDAAEEAERALAERSSAFRRERLRTEAGLDEVWRALPRDAVLVSYLKYEDAAAQERQRRSDGFSYVAFVTTAGHGAIAAVPLGPAAAIESAIAEWRNAIGSPPRARETAYRESAIRLRSRIWDPIAKFVNGTSAVFLVPDGALNLVSFGSLPVANGYLLEHLKGGLHYLAAERDLLPPGGVTARGGLLAMGGVEFGDQSAVRGAFVVGARRDGCQTLGQARFQDLPGSRREAAELVDLWDAMAGDATLLTGRAATESAVKRSVSNRRVIHLATHAFFLGECAPAAPGTRAVGGITSATPDRPGSTTWSLPSNPLLLSGLALAGSSERTASVDDDDGILTAEEIAGLNLQGTEWAVLSACDTGLGEIRAGEGVFGLRRAFQIAGVRTVIMSLWSVEDQATRLWMRALYEGRLQRRLSTADAVREASLTVLRDRRAKGQSTHPFYWAAFIAAGDWR